MAVTPLEQRIKTLIEPLLTSFQVQLYHLEYVKEGGDSFLRVYLQNDAHSVDLDLCVEVSEALSPLLDQQTWMPPDFMLEVSSPGAERPLPTAAHLKEAVGEYVYIHLKELWQGKPEWVGDLVQFDGDMVTLKVKNKTRFETLQIPYRLVDQARISVRF